MSTWPWVLILPALFGFQDVQVFRMRTPVEQTNLLQQATVVWFGLSAYFAFRSKALNSIEIPTHVVSNKSGYRQWVAVSERYQTNKIYSLLLNVLRN